MAGRQAHGSYIMPAEWEKHDATWLAWPKDPLTFPPEIIGSVEGIYVKMIRSLARGEKVNLLVDDAATQKRVSSLIGESDGVIYHTIQTADVWMRDYGPIFVRDGSGGLAATKWIFNAWGNKYDELKRDSRSGMEVAETTGLRIIEPGLVLEGGSIDTNGRGTCITTEQCLLNKNRNPSLGRGEIEKALEEYLGFTNIIWLGSGIAGDDTDGHIDDLVRFVDEDTVLCMVEEDGSDENYAPLKENLERLKLARDQYGRRLNIVEVPMPKRKVGGDERLPASYANFYIGNSAVLVPIFEDVNDARALSAIAKAFPKREVIGINCETLVYGFGGIHCVTQQQPSA